MKKTFQLADLDCAHCAAKMEDAIKKINGVTFAQVSFMKSSLTIEAEDENFDQVMKEAQKAVKKQEPDCEIEGI